MEEVGLGRGGVSSAVQIMEFVRNDAETKQIIAKAAHIVPKACDILGISLSDSESDYEEDTAGIDDDRSPAAQPILLELAEGDDSSSSSLLDVEGAPATTTTSRKRCASTPPGQSNPPINKKRRFPSISSSSSRGNNAIKAKMFRDLEFLRGQFTQLAAVEKVQAALMEKFILISNQIGGQQHHHDEQDDYDEDVYSDDEYVDEQDAGDTNVDNDDDIFEDNDDGTNYTASNNIEEQVGYGILEGEIFTDTEIQVGAEETVDTLA